MANSVDLEQWPRSVPYDSGLCSFLRSGLSVRIYSVNTVWKERVTSIAREKCLYTFRGHLASPLVTEGSNV